MIMDEIIFFLQIIFHYSIALDNFMGWTTILVSMLYTHKAELK